MSSITPTIGRKIYYVPTLEDTALGMTRLGTTEHVDATIAYVDEQAGTVNLRITDHVGMTFVRHGVSVGDEPQPGSAHWMSYQLSQAGVKPAPADYGWKPVSEYEGASVERASIGTLTGGSLAAQQGFANQLQDRSLLPAGVAAQIDSTQASSFAEPGMQTGTEIFGERLSTDSGSAESFQAGIDALQRATGEAPAVAPAGETQPVVVGNVVGD